MVCEPEIQCWLVWMILHPVGWISQVTKMKADALAAREELRFLHHQKRWQLYLDAAFQPHPLSDRMP